MRKRKQDSKLVIVLEWICGFALGVALISTTWACFVYKERNGSFLPKMDNRSLVSSDSDTIHEEITPPSDIIQWDQMDIPETPAPNQPQDETEKGVSIAGFKTLRIDANTTNVSVDFYNPSVNGGTYLISFEFLFPGQDGSYESIYSSGMVEAGYHIRNITLSRPIPRGTYEDCILRMQPYLVSDGSAANTADISFTLYAE